MQSDESLRERWQKAKVEARDFNNGNEVDIRIDGKKLDLGKKLDAWEKAANALDKARRTARGTDREETAYQRLATADDVVTKVLARYSAWLLSNPIAIQTVSEKARELLDNALTTVSTRINNRAPRKIFA